MDEPAPPRLLSFTGGAGWTAALVFALMFAVSTTAALRDGAGDDIVNVTACYALVHFGLAFVLLRIYRPDDRLRDALGFRATNPIHVLFAGLLGAGLYPILARIDDRFAIAFPDGDAAQESIAKLFAAPTPGAKIALFVAVGVVIPLSEEIFFRGMLFGALLRGRGEVAKRLPMVMLACAGYFALAQGDLRALASSLILGIVLSWVRARSGSTFLTVVVHVAHLAVPLGPLLHGGEVRGDASFGTRWLAAGLGATIVAFGVLALLFRTARPTAARALDAADATGD
ncbi:hypothetical protein BH09MYX1_BH09MYX1_21900 [soil metagenome]